MRLCVRDETIESFPEFVHAGAVDLTPLTLLRDRSNSHSNLSIADQFQVLFNVPLLDILSPISSCRHRSSSTLESIRASQYSTTLLVHQISSPSTQFLQYLNTHVNYTTRYPTHRPGGFTPRLTFPKQTLDREHNFDIPPSRHPRHQLRFSCRRSIHSTHTEGRLSCRIYGRH
jgi:hypothetical protein